MSSKKVMKFKYFIRHFFFKDIAQLKNSNISSINNAFNSFFIHRKQSIIQLCKMPKRVKMKEIGKALEIMPPKL